MFSFLLVSITERLAGGALAVEKLVGEALAGEQLAGEEQLGAVKSVAGTEHLRRRHQVMASQELSQNMVEIQANLGKIED
jgi:hypothetical protein